MKRFLSILLAPILAAGDVTFEKEIKPLLEDYCFDCHGDGASKGDFTMDEYDNLSAHLDDIDHWLAVWRNVRSQIMPPPKRTNLISRKSASLWGGSKSECLNWTLIIQIPGG